MKKIVSLLLALCLLLGVSAAFAEDKIELTAFQYALENQNTDFNNLWFFDELEAQTNTHVTFDMVKDADWDLNVNLMFAVPSQMPDMILRHAVDIEEYGVTQQLLLPLDEYLTEEIMPNYMSRLNINHAGDSIPASDGKTYYIGYLMAQNVNHTGTWYVNQVELDKLGLDIPVTIDEWETAFEGFRDEMHCESAYALPADGVTYSGIASVYGPTGVYQENGIIKSGLVDTDAYRQLMTLIHRWYDTGIIYSDFLADTDSASSGRPNSSLIASGAVGCWRGQSTDLEAYTDLIEEDGADVVGLAPAVLNREDAETAGDVQQDDAAANMGVSFSTDCHDAELCVRYFNYFFTPEGDLLANYGVEGLTFEYDANGHPQFTELVTNNPDGMSFDQAQWILVAGSTEGPYVFDHTKYLTTYSAKQIAAGEAWVSYTPDETALPASINSILTGDALTEYASLSNDLETYTDECALKFIMGQMSIEDDWDTYVDAVVNTFHFDRIMELSQQALDEYLGN